MVTLGGLLNLDRPVRLVPVAVTTANPLTVTYPDGSTHPALGIVGLAYATSGKFVAAIQDGQPPLVFPVGSTLSGGVITG